MAERSPTAEEIGYAIAVAVIEVMGVLSRNGELASLNLEQIANQLLTLQARMPDRMERTIIAAVARTLVGTEDGSTPPSV